MQFSPKRPDGVAVTASGARAPSPGFDYTFTPPFASDLSATFSQRHSRSHTTPILSSDSSGYHPATPLLDLQLTPAPVEHSAQSPLYRPKFGYEIEGYLGPPQEKPDQFRIDRPPRMRRTISHNPPVFPSFPYPAGSEAPSYPTEPVSIETFALDAPAAATAAAAGEAACADQSRHENVLLGTDADFLSGSKPAFLPPRGGSSAGSSYHLPLASEAGSLATSDASTCGIPLVLTAGSLSPVWAATSMLNTTGNEDEVSPPPGASDRLSPFDQEMQRSGSIGSSTSSSSAQSYSTTATSTITTTSAGRSDSPPEGGVYKVASENGKLAPPRASSAGPVRSSSLQPSPAGQYPSIDLPASTVKLPRPAKCRNINRNVWLPPPQALLAPGVVAPSAGAIAAPNGRGTALFPGTDSPGIPTDEDYQRMVTKTARGRHPRGISDLGIPPALANDPSAPPTMEQLQFAGLTKTGHPKKVYVCKAPDCERVFKRSEHLKRHVRSIHTYEKRKPTLEITPGSGVRFGKLTRFCSSVLFAYSLPMPMADLQEVLCPSRQPQAARALRSKTLPADRRDGTDEQRRERTAPDPSPPDPDGRGVLGAVAKVLCEAARGSQGGASSVARAARTARPSRLLLRFNYRDRVDVGDEETSVAATEAAARPRRSRSCSSLRYDVDILLFAAPESAASIPPLIFIVVGTA